MTRTLLIVNNVSLGELSPVLYMGGVPYGQVREIFRVVGGNMAWQGNDSQAVITWRSNMLILPASGTNALLNGEKRTLKAPTRVSDAKLYICLESLAELFAGSMRHGENALHLFLPVGHLTGMRFASDQLVLNWTGNQRTTPAGNQAFLLEGTGWPQALRAVSIERTPEGHLLLRLEVKAGQLEHQAGEQGLRVDWKESGQKLAGRRIALDAGHGGQQPGAIGTTGTPEKDITRRVVDRLTALLVGLGAEVIDVRPGDQTVSLSERVSRARQAGAHIYLSIHVNGHERPEVSGTETFYFAENMAAHEMAGLVQYELVSSLKLRDRGVKQAAFYVLRAQPEIPSVVTELGFITNPTEERFLLREGSAQRAAEALLRAICRYFDG